MGSWIQPSYHRYRRRRHGMIPPLLIVPPPNHGATTEDTKILQILNGRITDTLIMRFIVPPLRMVSNGCRRQIPVSMALLGSRRQQIQGQELLNQGMIAVKLNINLIYRLFLKSKDECRMAFDLPIQTRLTDQGLSLRRRLSLPNQSQYEHVDIS